MSNLAKHNIVALLTKQNLSLCTLTFQTIKKAYEMCYCLYNTVGG
jgi:hypothetical protein